MATTHITAGLDGSRESVTAARWTAREAELRGIALNLVHVDEGSDQRPPVPDPRPEITRRSDGTLLRDATQDLHRLHPDLEITTQSLRGVPSETLCGAAGTSAMPVPGSRSLGTIAGHLVGSVAAATIAGTQQPVVPGRAADTDPADGPVVVGVDIHQHCDKLRAFVFDEASRRSCLLRAVYGGSMTPVYRRARTLTPGIHEQTRHGIATLMGEMLNPWRDKYPSVEVNPAHPLRRAVIQVFDASSDAALVVVGRSIRAAAAFGTHVGAITHALLHHDAAPVAVITHD
ncbi:universal stress protein [Streptomyces sp. NPDC058430]|uniref:universal stress protein n=1 Tax=Streptomyces sp. NPDC058430 TaxID=3346495 RepID=UPI00364843A2